jgi:chromosome segregation ATPase
VGDRPTREWLDVLRGEAAKGGGRRGGVPKHHQRQLLAEVDALAAELAERTADRDHCERSYVEVRRLLAAAEAERDALRVELGVWQDRAMKAELDLAAINAPYLGGAAKHIEALYEDQRQSRVREWELVERAEKAEAALSRLRETVTRVHSPGLGGEGLRGAIEDVEAMRAALADLPPDTWRAEVEAAARAAALEKAADTLAVELVGDVLPDEVADRLRTMARTLITKDPR